MENSQSAKDRKEEHKLWMTIRASIADALLLDGTLVEEDFDDEKVLMQKIRKFVQDTRKAGVEFGVVIDHQPSMLDRARKHQLKEEFELAYVFYATYFEHLINGVIQAKCIKEGISNSTYKELIRRVSLEDKFSWVLELLKLPSFNTTHWKTIKTISEKRNNFIHYKYQPKPDEFDHEEREWKTLEKKLRLAITYCKSYQTRLMYGGKAKKLRLKRPFRS